MTLSQHVLILSNSRAEGDIKELAGTTEQSQGGS